MDKGDSRVDERPDTGSVGGGGASEAIMRATRPARASAASQTLLVARRMTLWRMPIKTVTYD